MISAHLYAAKAFVPGCDLRWLLESGAIFEGARVNRWFTPCGNPLMLERGDLALFDPPRHLAVATGRADWMSHAGFRLPDAGTAMRIADLLRRQKAGTLTPEDALELKDYEEERGPCLVRLPFLQALYSGLESAITFYQLRPEQRQRINPDGILR